MIIQTNFRSRLLACALFLLAAMAGTAEPLIVPLTAFGPTAKLSFWTDTSLKRVFPSSPPGSTNLNLLAARNGKISFQACLRNDLPAPLNIKCSITCPLDIKSRVRFVGLVPMPHFTPGTAANELDGLGFLPGLVPDPLYPQSTAQLGPFETRSFWITLDVPADATVGSHDLSVEFAWDDGKQKISLPVTVQVSSLVIQPRRDFHVIHWWRGEATWDYYKTGMFDDRWYDITKAQLTDMLAHGSDVVYIPMFFDRRETFKHPCQLLVVNESKPGVYEFDWSGVKKFTDMCKTIGFKKFEWSHMWIYWGVKNPMRIYKKIGEEYVMLWPPDTGATSDTYVNFLKQFLPSFHQFLTDENLLADSYFHLSDEPGSGEAVENYRRARKVLRDLAPWMKVMDALSDIRYGKEGLTDMPIPLDSAAQAYIDAGIPHWVYYCCSPTGAWLNRFLDTPLPKVRMSGWLFYHLGAKGFLHWGFNYWDKLEQEAAADPFHDASGALYPGIPYGDPFMIYPGADDQPVDSLRWEVFAESLQDYAILQTAGIQPNDPMLSSLKSYADFPKNEQWLDDTLQKILTQPATPTSAK